MNRLRLDGLDQLRAALMRLPEELASEGADIVQAAAEQAARETQAAYPVRTGTLQRRVTAMTERSKGGALGLVRSRAPHAHLYEFGTKKRKNDKGANRGVMPAAPEAQRMIPKVIRIRKRMTQQLIDLVRKAGFTVDA